MIQPFKWLIIVFIGGVLVAGCGNGNSTTSSQSSSTSAPSSTAGTTTSSTPVSTATTSTSPTTTPSGSAGVADAVAACKSVIKQEPTLSASVKAKVEGICNKAAGGDVAGARTAAKEVCIEIVNASPIPAGPIKEKALATCKSS